MITASFGTKAFSVSPQQIYTPNGVSVSEELNLEETEVSGKKPTVNIKGIKLKSLSFELVLDSRSVDVYAEISYWEKTLKGKKSQNFKLGNHSLGKYYLSKLDLKNIILAKNGGYSRATLTLSFIEDGKAANNASTTTSSTTKKASTVKASSSTSATKVRIGSTIKPKSGVRWYYTAENAIKKSGTSGKAYQKNMTVSHTYSKNGKIVCVNPQKLGWLKIEDVTVVKY